MSKKSLSRSTTKGGSLAHNGQAPALASADSTRPAPQPMRCSRGLHGSTDGSGNGTMSVPELAGPSFKDKILNPNVASQPIQARLFPRVVLLRCPWCGRGSTDPLQASGGNWQTFNPSAECPYLRGSGSPGRFFQSEGVLTINLLMERNYALG
jgi:hypothetical protein